MVLERIWFTGSTSSFMLPRNETPSRTHVVIGSSHSFGSDYFVGGALMSLQLLQKEMDALSVQHYKELQTLLRKHSNVLNDRKATLMMFAYMSNFIYLGWPNKDKQTIIKLFLEVQKDVDKREG